MIRNKKKDKRIKGKFSNIIIRNYIVFSVLLVILLFGVLFIVIMNIDSFDRSTKLGDLANTYKDREISDYGDTDITPYVGKDSYVVVFDASMNEVYSSDNNKNKSLLTKTIIDIIPKYNEEKYVNSEVIKEGRNKGCVLINGSTFSQDGYHDKTNIDIVDHKNNNKIIFSNTFPNKDRYTDSEYELLKKGTLKGYLLAKATYKSSGKTYTLVAFTKNGIKLGLKRRDQIFLSIGIGFACIYILMLILFSLWISRSVKKPLKVLEHGMKEVSSGKTGEHIQYSGPKEFVDICDNFNAMSTALYKSEKKNAQLQNENQRIISDISHDLKTPITVIQGYSKAISDGMVPPEEQEKYLKIITKKAEALTEQINEIHDYTKLDHPDFKYDMKPIDICEYTREYFARHFDELKIGGYNLDVDLPETSILVSIDISKFTRVYENLTNNFIKYNKSGKTMYCRIEYDDRSVTVKIGDDGIGIPKKMKESIFEPFVMGEKSRGNGGSGLGLAMVNKIVQYHNGTVELVEKPEKGMKTEFAIRLLRL